MDFPVEINSDACRLEPSPKLLSTVLDESEKIKSEYLCWMDKLLKPLNVELDSDLKDMVESDDGPSEETDTSLSNISIQNMATGLGECLAKFEDYHCKDKHEHTAIFQKHLEKFKNCRNIGGLIDLFSELKSK